MWHFKTQLVLASLLFLAAYDPLRSSISYLANRSLNARGQQLAEAFDHLEKRLPAVITAPALVEELLDPLHASGRVPICSIYLWDPRLDAFRFAGGRGSADRRPLEAVAPRPFTTGFVEGGSVFVSLDDGTEHSTTIAVGGIGAGSLTLVDPLPGPAASGRDVRSGEQVIRVGLSQVGIDIGDGTVVVSGGTGVFVITGQGVAGEITAAVALTVPGIDFNAAIGAKVRIKLGGKTLTRQVEGGGVGQGNQNDLTLHFGLGPHDDKVKYEVTWTNGARQAGETEVDRMIRVKMSE